MAHELTIRADGMVEMAYLEGVARWHGLGNELTDGASLDEWKIAAGMDWRAVRAQVRYAVASGSDPSSYRTYGEMVDGKFEGQVVLFRSDNQAPLGIVSTEFQLVQPGAIVDFWNGLVGSAGMQLQTLGTMFNGKKMWGLAKVGEAAIIDPRNIVRQNLLIATALDGSMATTAFYCDTVVVCNNTLCNAFGEGAVKVKINHRSKFDPDAVKRELGVESAQSKFQTTLVNMRQLAEKRVKDSDAVLIACELVKPGFAELDKKEQQRVENGKPLAAICERFLDRKAIGSEFDGYDGTAWGLLNSVTEYVDHAARSKDADNRMNSAFFGKGAAMKDRAYQMLTDYEPSLADVIAATPTAPSTSLLDSVIAETIL